MSYEIFNKSGNLLIEKVSQLKYFFVICVVGFAVSKHDIIQQTEQKSIIPFCIK